MSALTTFREIAMSLQQPTPQALADATRQVERKIGFLIHLGVYLLVNSGLIALNLLHPQHRFWAAAPLLGWGIGLLFHGLKVFVRGNPHWKRRMIEWELSKH